MTFTEQAQEMACDRARNKVRDAAMYLAQMGLSADTIRAAMTDISTTETERAIAWAAKHDAAEAAADREEFAEECAREDQRDREVGT